MRACRNWGADYDDDGESELNPDVRFFIRNKSFRQFPEMRCPDIPKITPLSLGVSFLSSLTRLNQQWRKSNQFLHQRPDRHGRYRIWVSVF